MFQAHIKKTAQNLETLFGVKTGALYLKGGSIAVRKWTDTEHPFRQESNFYYLTGFNYPDAHLVVSLETSPIKSTLLVPRYDDDHTLWCGPSESHESIKSLLGLTAVRYNDELLEVLETSSGATKTIHVLDGEVTNFPQEFKVVSDKLRTAITEARVIKTKDEIELMRKVKYFSFFSFFLTNFTRLPK